MKQEFKNGIGDVYCRLEYLPDEKVLYSAWFGEYLNTEHVLIVGEGMLTAMQEFSVKKTLNDNRELQATWDDANEWVAEYWMPKTIELGLEKIAHVFSPDIFTQIAAENMQENSLIYQDTLEVRTFECYDQAKSWLLLDSPEILNQKSIKASHLI